MTNSFQPTFTGLSSFFFVDDQKITLVDGLETIKIWITAGVLYLVVRDETEMRSPLLAFAVCGVVAMCLKLVRPRSILSLCKFLSKTLSHIFSYVSAPNARAERRGRYKCHRY